jgi:hypothetical protein
MTVVQVREPTKVRLYLTALIKLQRLHLAAHMPSHNPVCLVSPIFHKGLTNDIAETTPLLPCTRSSSHPRKPFATVLTIVAFETDAAVFIIGVVIAFRRSWLQASKRLVMQAEIS